MTLGIEWTEPRNSFRSKISASVRIADFSSAAVETWVTEEIQKRKLNVLVETADKIWG
jgi:hypothetical protein